MSATQLPLKMSVLRETTTAALSPAQIVERLAPSYGGEKQLNLSTVESHLMALRAVGLVEADNPRIIDGSLVLSFAATDAGRAKFAQYGNNS